MFRSYIKVKGSRKEKVQDEGDYYERRSWAPASHQRTVRALNGVGREWRREKVTRVCMIVLFSCPEVVVRLI